MYEYEKFLKIEFMYEWYKWNIDDVFISRWKKKQALYTKTFLGGKQNTFGHTRGAGFCDLLKYIHIMKGVSVNSLAYHYQLKQLR